MKSTKSMNLHSSDDENDDDFCRRPVGRMTSGQLRQWDGFHSEVSSLVKIAMPNNVHQVATLLKQFDGREAELIHTLQTMCRRMQSSTIPGNYYKKSNAIHRSRGAISTEAKDSVRRTSTLRGRKIDAIARIAAASTLDDHTKAVKPEYVVDGDDDDQYDRTNDDNDDDRSFFSKISLSLSYADDDVFNSPRRHKKSYDEDPSQIYSDDDNDDDDDEDDASYDEDEGDSYYDDDDDDDENETNIYDDDDEEEEEEEDDDASEGSSASWKDNHQQGTSHKWR